MYHSQKASYQNHFSQRFAPFIIKCLSIESQTAIAFKLSLSIELMAYELQCYQSTPAKKQKNNCTIDKV